MKLPVHKPFLQLLFLWNLLACPLQASAVPSEFSFGVIAYPFKTSTDDSPLRSAINDSDADNLAFVVANGIKSPQEPCNDNLLTRRKAVMDSAQNGLIVSLTASDWSGCKNTSGRSNTIERLNRIRDLFFSDEFSLGASKIPLLHQSASPKFRSYAENTRWEINNILFATINLPDNNNNYLPAAGRNSEFEDRLIANQDWLQRIVTYSTNKNFNGIVLFCDGNPLASPTNQNIKRDGFLEVRRTILALAAKFPGKILLIHNQTDPAQLAIKTITWQKNLGEFSVDSGWSKIRVSPSRSPVFSIGGNSTLTKNSRP